MFIFNELKNACLKKPPRLSNKSGPSVKRLFYLSGSGEKGEATGLF
jgi:hypothetical protein